MLLRVLGLSKPPAISTLPFGSRVAAADSRAVFIVGVAVKVLLTGSYNSELFNGLNEECWPPAISTLPLGSRVEVAQQRPVFIDGVVGANVFTDGGTVSIMASSIVAASASSSAAVTLFKVSSLLVPPNVNPLVASVSPSKPGSQHVKHF